MPTPQNGQTHSNNSREEGILNQSNSVTFQVSELKTALIPGISHTSDVLKRHSQGEFLYHNKDHYFTPQMMENKANYM